MAASTTKLIIPSTWSCPNMRTFPAVVLATRLRMHDHWGIVLVGAYLSATLNWRKMSTHALQKMTPDRFRVMSSAPRRKCPRNVVQMKEAMAAFFGSDSVAISCHCKRSKTILVKVLTEAFSLENTAS